MIDVLLNSVLPVFAVAAVGYVLAHRGVFDQATAEVINRFVFYFPLPILLFRLIATAPIDRFEWLLIVAYGATEFALYLLGFLIARLAFRRSAKESLLLGMAATYSNHVFYVLPIAQHLYGDATTVPIVAIITFDAVVLFGGTILILEATSDTGTESLRRLFHLLTRNPQIIAIAAGIAANVAGIPIVGGIDLFTRFVGDTAAPVSLFAVGLILAARTERADIAAPVTISAVKLIAMPAIAALLFLQAFPIDPAWWKPAMLVAAGPTGTMPFVLALKYGVPAATISRIILITTVGSLLTVTLMTQL